jgi:spermidine/putrescine transport system substrate-binding protein
MSREPIDRTLEPLPTGAALSRRDLLRRMAAAGFVVGGSGALLSACGGVEGTSDDDEARQQPAGARHARTAFATLTVSNWPYYIDKEEIKRFNRRFDTKVKYVEDINDNDEFFAKVRQELESDRPIGRDIVIITDWLADRWIDQGFVEPLDKRNIPNAKNVIRTLQSPPFDPRRTYTMPWQSGMSAIGYDPARTERKLTSVNDLFDPKFKGRVSMLSDWRDSAGLVLLAQGKDTRNATKDDYLEAIQKIDEENRKGQIRRFTGNDYAKDLASGSLWACVAYSGDVVQLKADNPKLEFLIPEEGALLWSDNMLIPKRARQPYGAETWMNYFLDPEVAAKNAAAINFVTPVKGAREVLERTDPKLAANELIFPSDATLAKLHPYPAPTLSQAEQRDVTAEMQKVAGA